MKFSVDVIKDLDQYYVVDVHVASRQIQKTLTGCCTELPDPGNKDWVMRHD